MRWDRIGIVVGVLCMAVSAAEADQAATGNYALVIHGGAGIDPEKMSAEERKEFEDALTTVLKAGQKMLAEGTSALDTVERTIRMLEDNPLFNAGRGAVFNSIGKHELDASIMDGRTKSCGAVAAVRTIRNPITLARRVMTETRHVLLASDGAEQFADSLAHDSQIERVENSYFSTDKRREDWERAVQKAQEKENKQSQGEGTYKGTVGCVALDIQGNLAAGTSTGGLTNKKFGRVGDSPIIGAGTYADNATCAVSCTGTGEYFIRNVIAYQVSALMAYKGLSLDAAAHQLIDETLPPDTGGLIAVGRDGAISMPLNTTGMSRGAADSKGRFEVLLGK